MRAFRALTLSIALATAFAIQPAQAQRNRPAMPAAGELKGTVKIAWIDPLSGMMAPVGQNLLRSWQFMAEKANAEKWAGDVRFEFVPLDNKASPQESLTVLKQAIDQGIRYVVQGAGSGAAIALSDAITKHNERNPGKEIVYLNYAAVDPSLTNERCSFWHFRLDVNADMKMEALTTQMAKEPKIKKVYLINQDYSFGHAVEKSAEDYLKRKRPDIQIVGKDRHPLAQVRDFAPYVAKIKAAGADTVVTGNWGSDMALLIKAAKDANANVDFYTYYAGTTGVPTAMGASGAERVKIAANWIPNNPGGKSSDIYDAFKKKYDDDFYTMQTHSGLTMLAQGMKKAGSIDPIRVAFAMEGAKFQTLNGEAEMRASDHQLQQNITIATWAKVDGKAVRYDSEKTGYGWRNDAQLDAYVAAQPTSCQMKRPSRP
ncbi:MAG: branched-chain amino acid ABC transporter substrate-binding protein [Burkholderiaceae bacterium]|nr:branched-chain amino acid ABC transporter substrate-binding protein [Burkholderiaceae bacterium]